MSLSPETARPSEPAAPRAAASPAAELERRLITPVVAKFDIARLPALPMIVDRALEASRAGDHDALREWLTRDPLLTLRALEAGRGEPGRGCEDRLAGLGPELLKALLLSAARSALGAGRETCTPAELGGYWMHSLQCAFLSRALAEACGYRAPQEAYLTGLLHDFGSFALLSAVPNTFRAMAGAEAAGGQGIPEHAGRLGTIHAQIGAALLEPLGLPFYVADAVLLHHAPKPELEDTHALVRVLRCAETLAQPRLAADQLGAVAELLGITPAQVAGADRAAAGALNGVLEELGIVQPAARTARGTPKLTSVGGSQQLSETLVLRFVREAQQSEAGIEEAPADQRPPAAGAWAEALPGAGGTVASILEHVADEALRLEAATALGSAQDRRAALAAVLPLAGVALGHRRAILFEADAANGHWPGWLVEPAGAAGIDLELPREAPRSLVARAAREVQALVSYDEARPRRLAGLDLQIARLLGADEIAVLPLKGEAGACGGVAVFGSPGSKAARLARDLPLLRDLVGLVVPLLVPLRAPQPAPGAAAEGGDAAERLRAATRSLVHEARNPLTVLKTYLELARRRAASGEALDKELEIADRELERVSRLLDGIAQPGAQAAPPSAPVDVNAVIKELLLVYGDALFGEKGIALAQELDEAMAPLKCDGEGLKQVLLNLLKNASEATPRDGRVSVRSAAQVNWEGRMMAEICVTDTGAGMSADKVAALFDTPAGDAARGLGLPTSLAIVQRMHGHLLCRSRPNEGSSFTVLLPRDAEAGAEHSINLDFSGAPGA